MSTPTLATNGSRGGVAANDPRWQVEATLGEIQAQIVTIREAQRVIEAFALSPDPLDTTGAFDRIYAEALVIEQAAVKLHWLASDHWFELVEAIRGRQ